MPPPPAPSRKTIVEQGDAYGRGDLYDGVTINLEFVSANPTGPIHIGGVRWAAVGDSLARIFQAQGGVVTREYYFNDHGAQIDRFARSLLASCLGEPAPEDGYGGAVHRRHRRARHRDLPRRPARHPARRGSRRCSARSASSSCSATSRRVLHDFGVDFDVYFHENELHESGAVERAIARLRDLGAHLRGRRRDLAPHDRLRRRQGPRRHQERRRGRLHLRRPRLLPQQARARLRAQPHHARRRPPRLRRPPDGDDARRSATSPYVNLEILIGQLVNLVRDGEPVRMSKRAGTVVTLEDLVDAVGVDAGRYALVRSSDRLARRHRPRPARPSAPTTTRSSTCSTPTRAPARSRATPRPPASTASAFDAVLLDARDRERPAGRPRRVPARRAPGRRAARAAPRRPLRRGARRRLPPLVRQLPRHAARRRARSPTCTAPASGSTTRPGQVHPQRARPAGRLRPREDVTVAEPDPTAEAPTTSPPGDRWPDRAHRPDARSRAASARAGRCVVDRPRRAALVVVLVGGRRPRRPDRTPRTTCREADHRSCSVDAGRRRRRRARRLLDAPAGSCTGTHRRRSRVDVAELIVGRASRFGSRRRRRTCRLDLER